MWRVRALPFDRRRRCTESPMQARDARDGRKTAAALLLASVLTPDR